MPKILKININYYYYLILNMIIIHFIKMTKKHYCTHLQYVAIIFCDKKHSLKYKN